jgi:putative addiction module component (TIGR02574 family)
MAVSRDEILREALTLPERDRAELICALIDSLDIGVEEGAEEAWRAEIERRAKELDSGAVESIPWEVVKARVPRSSRG